MSDKIYCGSGKTKSSQYGDFQSISICISDIPKEHITTAANGKEYVNLTVNKKKEVDKYGKDLAVTVDTWKPTGQVQEQVAAPTVSNSSNEEDTLPF